MAPVMRTGTKFARRHVALDDDQAVNLWARRDRCAPTVSPFALAFDQHVERLAHKRLVLARLMGWLKRHQTLVALALDVVRQLTGQIGGRRSLAQSCK